MKKDFSRDNWRNEYLYLIDDEYADEDYLPIEESDDEHEFIDTELLLAEEEGSLEEGYWHSNSLSELDAIQRGTLILDDDDLESLILGYETDEALLSSQYGLKDYAEYEADEDYEEELSKELSEDDDPAIGFLRLRDIEIPDDDSSEVKRLKRDIRMEALRRLEESARTLSDFKNLVKWYDELDANAFRRWRYHEIYRSGEDMPLESGETEDGAIFPAYMSDVISRQLRKGDFLDFIYCKPDTIHELVTTGYIIRSLKALKGKDKELFFFKVLEALSSVEVAEMRDVSDRYIRRIWRKLMDDIRRDSMEAIITLNESGRSLTGQERKFLTTHHDEYVLRMEA